MTHRSNLQARTILLFTLLSLLSFAVSLPANFSANASVLTTPEGQPDHQNNLKNDANKHKEDHHSPTNVAGASHAPTTVGRPVLRVDRGDISTLDLTLGTGSTEGMPK